jgi:hypothetical protein
MKLNLLDRIHRSELAGLSDVKQLPDYPDHYAIHAKSGLLALFRYDENGTIYVFDIVKKGFVAGFIRGRQ